MLLGKNGDFGVQPIELEACLEYPGVEMSR